MMRFTPFGGKKDRITKACKHLYDEGVIAFYAGHSPHHVRFLPPWASSTSPTGSASSSASRRA